MKWNDCIIYLNSNGCVQHAHLIIKQITSKTKVTKNKRKNEKKMFCQTIPASMMRRHKIELKFDSKR